jgi:hypothetical protein
VGGEPFPELIISTEEGADWFIHHRDRKLLNKYQQQLVTLAGTAYTRELIMADGSSGGRRRVLEDISVLQGP